MYQFPSERLLAPADQGRPIPLENKKILIEHQNFMCLVIILSGKRSRRATFFFFFTTMPGLSVFLSVSVSLSLSHSLSLCLSLSLSVCLSVSLSLSLSLSLIHMHTQIKNFMWTIILLRRKRRESFFTSRALSFTFCLFVSLSGSYFPSVSFFLAPPLSVSLSLCLSPPPLSLSLSLSLFSSSKKTTVSALQTWIIVITTGVL